MHYIRFLKRPTLEPKSKSKAASVKFTITTTTDLGDSTYPYDFEINAILHVQCIKHGKKTRVDSVKVSADWKAHMHALPMSIELQDGVVGSEGAFYVTVSDSRGLSIPKESTRLVLPNWQPVISTKSAEYNLKDERANPEHTFALRCIPTYADNFTVWEDSGTSIARHVWDAGVALTSLIQCLLAEWTCDPPSLRAPLANFARVKNVLERPGLGHILELGTGVGLVGIALAKASHERGFAVTLSDTEEARELAEFNIRSQSSQSEFLALDWENSELPGKIREKPPNVVLISDCIYNPDSAPALVKTLGRLRALDADVTVIMADKRRHDSESRFWELMEMAGWKATRCGTVLIPDSQVPPASEGGGEDADRPADEVEDGPLVEIWIFETAADEASQRAKKRVKK